MVDTPGRCRELDYCSIGQMRTLVRVPLGQPFVCPECGKPLRAPVSLNAPLSRGRLALWSVGTLGIFVLLYQCVVPGSQHRPARLAALTRPAAPPLPPRPQPAAAAPPANAGAAREASAAPPTPTAPAPAPAQPAPMPISMPMPMPGRPAAGAPPSVGAKVRMECSIDSSGVPTNCTMLKDAPAPPVPAAAIQPPPPPPPVKPAAARPPPALAPSPPPPIQKMPANRDVSALPVAGGAPPYPVDYVRDGRAGEVAVDCIIDSGGEPQHCKVTDVLGGRRFAEATVNWLNTGAVRFAPAIRNGVPVAEERHWHIAFPPR